MEGEEKRLKDGFRYPVWSSRYCGQINHRGLYQWRSGNNVKRYLWNRGLFVKSVRNQANETRGLDPVRKRREDSQTRPELGRLKTWRCCRWMMGVYDVSIVALRFTQTGAAHHNAKTQTSSSRTTWGRLEGFKFMQMSSDTTDRLA